jgi:DNA polymerase-3 subunit gamma/tau
MAYLVLARKYRPQTFTEMTGQEHVVRTLSNALKSGQLAHAFLFTGPRGVGKTTAARLVAKAVNCEKGPTPEPCGRCVACTEITEGRAVDVVEIDAASNNGVDNVRDIVEAVQYQPARDRYKVFVIDEVHMLSTGAFNALLKTLEEPPPHVKFVLATTDVHRVPETIVSRCQRFDFHRLTSQQIAEQLGRVAKAEGMSLSEASLGLLARAAEGGMRDALSLLDQVRAACGDAADDAQVAEAVGAVDSASILRIASALVGRDGALLLAELEQLYERGHEMKRVAEEIVRCLRNTLVAKLVPAAQLDLTEAERAGLAPLAQAADATQLTRLFDICQHAVIEVKLAEQPRYALEVALLKGCALAPGAQVSELIARLEEIAGGRLPNPPTAAGTSGASAKGQSQATPAQKREPIVGARRAVPQGATDESPSRAAPADPSGTPPMNTLWRDVVAEIEKVSPSAAPAMKQGVLLSIGEGEVTLQFAPGSTFRNTLERKRADVEEVLGRFFGRVTRLVLLEGAPSVSGPGVTASLAQMEQMEQQERSARVRDAARSHPNIQAAARILESEVKSVEEL